MSRPPIDLKGCRLQRRARTKLVGGGVEIVDGYREHPRLVRIMTREGPRGPTTFAWAVDGRPANDLREALRVLAGLPVQMELPL